MNPYTTLHFGVNDLTLITQGEGRVLRLDNTPGPMVPLFNTGSVDPTQPCEAKEHLNTAWSVEYAPSGECTILIGEDAKRA